MTTIVRLVAVLASHILTFLLKANVIKCSRRLFVFFLVGKNIIAEAALFAIQMTSILFAVLTRMIWLYIAPGTEYCLTASALEAISAHVNGGSWGHDRTCVVLCIVIYLTLRGLHDKATLAFDHVVGLAYEKIQLALLNLSNLFIAEIVLLLSCVNLFATIRLRASHEMVARERFFSCNLEAFKMDGVEAIRSLQQNWVFVLADTNVAEVTEVLVLHSFKLLHDTTLLLHCGRIVHSVHIPTCLLVFAKIETINTRVRLINDQG